jgi:hypothetical protein
MIWEHSFQGKKDKSKKIEMAENAKKKKNCLSEASGNEFKGF